MITISTYQNGWNVTKQNLERNVYSFKEILNVKG